ncbi:MAG: CDP-diacylglycerol--glycerol-3-phosphate 3-phosphatidyltransferase [Oscillospiraceae bacterium]|jgi:CDP-diacylglycerol--glycerol-3-phosphate 3-phosphatidyltransferase|nr:CDP-diacylglycerol--glycerol-3-phosphate 3-phosphatidyltransferase [Oscillospiraceae bacterium]
MNKNDKPATVWNLPNKLSLLRVVMTPFFVWALLAGNFIIALALFATASITDLIDGKVARKYHLITDLGKFLDPLADKILVISALICFIELGLAPSWAVTLIAAREFFVSGIRLAASGQSGKVIAADFPGKLKTALTMVAIIAILALNIFWSGADWVKLTGDVLIYLSTAATVWSGADYFWKYRGIFK